MIKTGVTSTQIQSSCQLAMVLQQLWGKQELCVVHWEDFQQATKYSQDFSAWYCPCEGISQISCTSSFYIVKNKTQAAS